MGDANPAHRFIKNVDCEWLIPYRLERYRVRHVGARDRLRLHQIPQVESMPPPGAGTGGWGCDLGMRFGDGDLGMRFGDAIWGCDLGMAIWGWRFGDGDLGMRFGDGDLGMAIWGWRRG